MLTGSLYLGWKIKPGSHSMVFQEGRNSFHLICTTNSCVQVYIDCDYVVVTALKKDIKPNRVAVWCCLRIIYCFLCWRIYFIHILLTSVPVMCVSITTESFWSSRFPSWIKLLKNGYNVKWANVVVRTNNNMSEYAGRKFTRNTRKFCRRIHDKCDIEAIDLHF